MGLNEGQMGDMVYADVPAFLHLAARLSLQAHLIHLTETGQAVCADGLWRPLNAD